MADDNLDLDAEIIHAAYAEKVKEAFKVFAENIGMGQNEKTSRERFLRSLELVRRARDLALQAMSDNAEPASSLDARETSGSERASGAAGLSEADRAMIEQALAGTTGVRPLPRR